MKQKLGFLCTMLLLSCLLAAPSFAEDAEEEVPVGTRLGSVYTTDIVTDDLFIVGVAQDREHAALHAERRLDDIGDVFDHVLALALAIDHLHAAGVLMLREVVVRAVGNAPELAPAEREARPGHWHNGRNRVPHKAP